MPSIPYVTITNNCEEEVTINIRYPKPMKESLGKYLNEIVLFPNEKTYPLPYHLIIGAKGWKTLKETDCVLVELTEFEPRFTHILNVSKETLNISITPDVDIEKKKPTSVRVSPKKAARSLDRKSIDEPSELIKLEKEEKIKITPVRYIGPPTDAKGSAGSFFGESVYVCYKCGGPIIFRGSPPRPIHI
jgi:hypothetical protein